MDSLIKTKTEGNILHVQLDDGKANVLSTTMMRALIGVAAEAKAADAVLLSGRAKVFCGGLDLNEVFALSSGAFSAFLDLFHEAFTALFTIERPLVIAARGSAVAGGAILLCCGDLRFSSRDQGVIGVNEARLGLQFPVSALEIVRSALNTVEGSRALLLGELFNKEQALRHGFLHDLVEPEALEALALEHAKDAAQVSGKAAAAIKLALREEPLLRMTANKERSHREFMALWQSPDGQTRLRAAMERMKKK